jgi:chromosome-anchoring protein RacA
MYTSDVAKLLGVSQSTIQRWVKQLGLPMEKNERGHYLFNQDGIDLLKGIQEQIQNGISLQDINPDQRNKPRKGIIKAPGENDKVIEMLLSKVTELESKLNAKADSVASYQLLHHRGELEELQNQVKTLMERVNTVENQMQPDLKTDIPLVHDQPRLSKKTKKKNIISYLLGF